jgi:hypothetical protein
MVSGAIRPGWHFPVPTVRFFILHAIEGFSVDEIVVITDPAR